jgi:hypothetical protein
MANEIVKKAPSLPADLVNQIAAGIARSHVGSAGGGRGQTLLRLMTSGAWVFGQSNDAVQQGSSWLGNIASLKHGYCCWHESQLIDEVMVEMWTDAPVMPLTHACGAVYKPQLSIELKCLDGADAGVQVLYKSSSYGGTAALFELKEKIRNRVQTVGGEYLFPVIELGSTSYANKKHGGTTYNPVLAITGWADINGEIEGATEDTKVTDLPPKPSAKPPLRAVEDPPAAATGQRRRPGAR